MAGTISKTRRSFLKDAAVIGGAASLGVGAVGCQTSEIATESTGNRVFPAHNDRTKGWLKFLWQKSTFQDDWGYSDEIAPLWGMGLPRGEINWDYDGKGPHPWWDQYTGAPMLSFPRFDLADSSYTMLLMADQTPAWREVYTRILDELATRHTAYWAAIDWNTFIGPSPNRDQLNAFNAPGYQAWPERLRGNYDRPGWTANGVEPWGLQRDPIAADGNLFFRGWLNLILSIYKYVSGDDKWERPWEVAGYENQMFEWTQPKVVEHLHRQYTDHPEGPHCENTKIWPYCNSAAGLGMYLSDQLGVTNSHGAFENFVEFMRNNYMGINSRNEIEWSTFYYDPLENFKVNMPGVGVAGVGVAFYLLPQSREIATQIYDALANTAGWRDPNREIDPSGLGLTMAKALGDETAVRRLKEAAERAAEPRWFGNDSDKFGWYFNYGEPWPRGQGSSQMMLTEIAASDWINAFQVRHLDKYTAPTLESVDFPNIGVETAWNDKETGELHIGTYVGDRSARGRSTSWRVSNIPNASEAVVFRDGERMTNVRVVDDHTIEVSTDIDQHHYEIHTGYFGQDAAKDAASNRPGPMAAESGASAIAATKRTAEQNAKAAEVVMMSGSANCPCCAGGA